MRYIKQLKCRHGNYTYDSDNVIVATIEKVGTFLQFVVVGYGMERVHLCEPSDAEASQEIATIKQMVSEGKSYRNVVAELGVSLSKVQRAMKK